jgi:transposase
MYYIGIDVSTKESALCILDGKGKIVRETKLPTDPEIIARFIAATGRAIERIGLESGCTAAWLFAGLQRHGWPSPIGAALRIRFAVGRNHISLT